jgi:hypothetical protein
VLGEQTLPSVNSSASIDDQGKLHISLCNIDPSTPRQVVCSLNKFHAASVSGTILTAKEMNAHNTFDEPQAVKVQPFSNVSFTDNSLTVVLPSKSVVVLEVLGTCDLSPAIELKNPNHGVHYQYYEGRWTHLPAFDSLTAVRSGVIDQFSIPEKNSGENFALQYTGYIKIPKDGTYTFFANSDDGALISLDDNLVVDNDGRHAPVEQSGTVVLKKGFHKIAVEFFQAGGGKVLTVSFEGPALQKQIIPAELLFRE